MNFIKYPIYVGANRGRGQVNPTGEKTNNNPILSPATGQITNVETLEKGGYKVIITDATGKETTASVPKG